jgi:hypothetical protein
VVIDACAAFRSTPRVNALVFLLAAAASTPTPSAAPPDLATVAQKSGFVKTGRYEEVIRLCSEFAAAYPGKVKCVNFGGTPEGRPMLAVIASADGTLDPADAKQKDRPVILFQGGIHAGEIDGKDAGFLALQEMLDGKAAPGALAKVTAVFVPVFNVDGHERFGAHNRPNQVGPEEMGWRVTSQNLNLNRDYMKADAPEMRAMLHLLEDWSPIVYLDLHVTDGAKFQHELSFLVDPLPAGDEGVKHAAFELRDGVIAKLKKEKHLPIGDFYPSFVKDDDPASGFALYSAPPRFSTEYWSLHDRIGVLVETHSWKDYANRVRSTHDALIATFELATKRAAAWQKAAHDADAANAALAGKPVTLAWDNDLKQSHLIDFQGYAYTRTPSEVSGGTWTQYDVTKPLVWKVPLFDGLAPALTANAPLEGYLVPAAVAPWIRDRLEAHGIEFTTLKDVRPRLGVQTFRATETTFAPSSYEGRQKLTVKGAWAAEPRDIPPGSLFVPIRQAKARLVMELFEPQAPDSFLSWGFFNGFFEQKEYMEGYVEEEIAREMLKDPAVKAEFDAQVAKDPEFAKSPEKRLAFFYRRHPSWDERMGLYPVYRTDVAP